MSTTIHPAYRLSSDANLFKVADDMVTMLTPKLTDIFRREAVSLAVREFDDSDSTFSEFLKNRLITLQDSLKGTPESFDDKYDLLPFRRILDFQATFFHNKVRDEYYVILNGESLDREAELSIVGVNGIASEFSYWNGSDSQINGSNPNVTKITEAEWLRRRDSWHETLTQSSYAQQGLVRKVFDSLSIYGLLRWRAFENHADSLLSENKEEERFRSLVFNTYLANLRNVYPDLDMIQIVSSSYRFMNLRNDRDYSSLPFVEEQKLRLDDVIEFAEARVAAFPLIF